MGMGMNNLPSLKGLKNNTNLKTFNKMETNLITPQNKFSDKLEFSDNNNSSISPPKKNNISNMNNMWSSMVKKGVKGKESKVNVNTYTNESKINKTNDKQIKNI